MRQFLIAMLATLLAACHEPPVKCDAHLTPINQVAKAATGARIAPPSEGPPR